MKADPTLRRARRFIVSLMVCAVAGVVGAAVAVAADAPERTRVDREAIERLGAERLVVQRPANKRPTKVANALLDVIGTERDGEDWRETARRFGLLVDRDSVLVEIRTEPEYGDVVAGRVESVGGRVRHHTVPSLMEAWLPPPEIEVVAKHPDVHGVRPARLVRRLVGSTTSEGVEVLNVSTAAVDYDYHDLGADGTGVLIANIDGGYSGYAALQSSGDWPLPADLRRFEIDGGPVVDCDVSSCSDYTPGFGYHGAATVEITFDIAPGADYMTYATTTIGDWYEALLDAAGRGADVVSQSLGAPLDGIGDGSECPPIWPAPCGTIAEAAGIARAQGALVVNASSNSGTEHWGGSYADSGDGTHDWGSGGNLNIGDYCFYNGELVAVDFFWNDWTDVDHDYDLYLFEWTGAAWEEKAHSWYLQDGGTGQTPQEAIRYVVSGASSSGGCGPGGAPFAILVDEWNAATPRFLQVFADNWGLLTHITEDRSLGFPADSPNVYTVGAIDVASPGSVEYYSSEGPVLGPGGSQGAPSPPNPKPDGVSAARVSTETYGPGDFAGTSAATPHVAGVAALLTQLRNEKYAIPPTSGNPEGIHRLLSTFALEDPTFPANHTTERGNGLVALRFCDESVAVSNNEWIMLGLPCTRRDSSTVAEVLGDDLDLVGTYWEVWNWDGETAGYRQLFESDQMRPGVGYWLLYEGDATVDIQGLVQDRSESYPFTLFGETSTYGRANFLGHAFEFDVAWPDVTVIYAGGEHTLADAINDGVMRNFMWKPYTSTGYVEHDGLLGEGTLHGFNGFWVKAFQDTELRVPTSLAAETTGDSGRIGQTVGWSVSLQATALGVTAHARIGQLPDSLETWDLHDAEHMPSFEEHQLSVVMPHPEWGEFAGDYVRDYHPWGRTDAWRFEVRSNLKAKVVLRWDGPMSVMEQSVIVDLETGKTIPLIKLQNEGYGFKMNPGARGFLWRVR